MPETFSPPSLDTLEPIDETPFTPPPVDSLDLSEEQYTARDEAAKQQAQQYAARPDVQATLALPDEAPPEVKQLVAGGYTPEQAFALAARRPPQQAATMETPMDRIMSAIQAVSPVPLEALTQSPFELQPAIPELPRFQDQPTLMGKLNVGTGQVLGGLMNLPAGIWNFATSPVGVALGGIGELGPLATRALALGFTVDQVIAGMHAGSLQQQVELAAGAALGAHGAIHEAAPVAPEITARGLEPMAIKPEDVAFTPPAKETIEPEAAPVPVPVSEAATPPQPPPVAEAAPAPAAATEPAAPEIPPADLSAVASAKAEAPPVTYDEAQARIDNIEDNLLKQGVDITKIADPAKYPDLIKSGGYQPEPPELTAAYAARDAIGDRELTASTTELQNKLTQTGLSESEADSILNGYGIKPGETGAAAHYIAQEHATTQIGLPLNEQAERAAYALASERGEMFDELKDISPKTLRDAANAVKTVNDYLLGTDVPKLEAPPTETFTPPAKETIEPEGAPAPASEPAPPEAPLPEASPQAAELTPAEQNALQKLRAAKGNLSAAGRAKLDRLEARAAVPEAPAPASEAGPPVKPVEATPEVARAAKKEAGAPETATKTMRVQKAYLLDALDQARKEAPEGLPSAPIAETDLARFEETSPYKAELAPLIEKYGLSDYRIQSSAFTPMEGEPLAAVDRPATHEELMQELRQRILDAKQKEYPKIRIEVPGDGTFEIVNSKEAIAQFRDEARKRFPTTQTRAAEPRITGRTEPEAIPKLGKRPATREDLIKIAGQAASEDETRFTIHQTVASTGDQLVSTDGRRLVAIDYKGPTAGKETLPKGSKAKPGEKPALFDTKTLKRDKTKEEAQYPNWKQVVPDPANQKKYATLDTGAMLKLVNQAKQMTSERNQSMKIWIDDKGKLGITASDPDVGQFAGGEANPDTAKPVAAYNPDFFADGLRIARQLGHDKVDFYLDKKTPEMSPMVLQAKGMKYVLMPMRLSDSGTLADLAERPVGEHPMATGPVASRANTFNELRGLGADQAIREMEDRGIPTTQVEQYVAKVNARLTMGKPRPPLTEFDSALRADLEKWDPEAAPPPASEAGPPAGGTIEEANKAAQQAAQEGTEPEVYGFGGGRLGKDKPAPDRGPSNTPEQVQQTQQQKLVGNTNAPKGGIIGSLMSLIAPGARSAEHLRAAETLGSKLGPMHRRAEIANHELKPFDKQFDKLGVDREGVAPADNPGTQFASAMSTGKPVDPKLRGAKAAIEKLFQARIKLLDKIGAPLTAIREAYFPGMWTKESREAFNTALQQAFDQGVIPRDMDLNDATPEQRAWVKDKVDQYVKAGTGSEQDMLPYLSRRPLHGKETFRKEKVFDDVLHAQEFGLRPISNNPVKIVKLKLGEMDKSIMAHDYFNEQKAKGRLQLITPFEKAPPGWTQVNDPYGTVYGPPMTTLKEWVDKNVYEGLLAVADALGVKHERGPAIGGRRLGYASTAGDIATRTATETSVLAHELGHQLDFKYGLWDTLGIPTKYGAGKSAIEQELRAVADLTERGRYARKKAEKMAQVLEAYIHSPEKMQQVAPTLYSRFDEFVKSTPELRPLTEIKPGLALKELQAQKYVGLPIMARRIVPEADAEILNNYLSSSLYNNRYFGDLYKAWMSTASVLNQSQLGVGSAFHAGFTSGDVQVSAVANLLKDMYGVLRGNRSVGDLANTAGRVVTAMVRTPIQGDRILNAWRDPEPAINPRVAQVVRAGELAGAGFEPDRGTFTTQTGKMRSDWYSGHALRAAARSPIAATEMMAAPIMKYLVPRQKAGVFGDSAWRIIEQNPGKTLEELTPQFRQAWHLVDRRLGQVQYDRIFMNNVAKNVLQGTIRAPGWTGGTIAELGGAFPDAYRFMREWVQTGRLPAELPDRVAYTMGLLLTTSIVNGALTYAFTGQRPTGLDYFAFRDGGKDEYGNDTRFLLPTYMKDILSYARHPSQTLINKLHPLTSMLAQIAQNKDYYGVEVRHPDDPLYKQGLQLGGFVVKQFEPFWIRGIRQQVQSAGNVTARAVLPYVGIMPAPRELTETPAQRLAGEINRSQMPVGGRTQEQFQRATNFRSTVSDLQRGRTTLQTAVNTGMLRLPDVMRALTQTQQSPIQRAVEGMGTEDAVRVWKKADANERDQIRTALTMKIINSRTLDFDRKQQLMEMVTPTARAR